MTGNGENEAVYFGSARSHATGRKKLRKRLEGEGLPPDEVRRQVEELRARQGREVVPQGLGRKPGPPHLPGENARRKRALASRDGESCRWCGAALDVTIRGLRAPSPPRATIDHVVPRSAGGTNGLDNLALSCEPCNQERGGIHRDGAHPHLVGTPSKIRRRPPRSDRKEARP